MQDSDLAVALRALGHPVRLNILRILAEKCDSECCCADVTGCLPLAQSTVSQHIKVLLEAGLISRQSNGTRNRYRLNTARIQALKAAHMTYLSNLASPTGAAGL